MESVRSLMMPEQTRAVNYRDQVKRMLSRSERRLIVNVDDLRDYNRAYCDGRAPSLDASEQQLTKSTGCSRRPWTSYLRSTWPLRRS